jgi:hypothetical protein
MRRQQCRALTAAVFPTVFGIIGILCLALTAGAQAPGKARYASVSGGDSQTTRLHITVTGGKYDKPVDNASVYIRFPEKPGSSKLAELDLKTDENGNVKVPPVPRGKIMIQVVATAWKTFGKWYDMEQPEEDVKIQLEDPPHWY